MKILILSDYDVVSEYIKDALSELQTYTTDKHSWYKGKFYTKELLLIEKYDQENLSALLDQIISNEQIKKVISIGLGNAFTSHLRQGDILVNDYPGGSCQDLVDQFLNYPPDEDDDKPLRIFAGTIIRDASDEQNKSGLACIDLACEQLFPTIKSKGLSSLAVRIINKENDTNGLDRDIANVVSQKLLLRLKKTVEQAS